MSMDLVIAGHKDYTFADCSSHTVLEETASLFITIALASIASMNFVERDMTSQDFPFNFRF